ncbi:haloacid dehalogenase-like hydrolase [Marinilabiliaceae bacterium JC017]|nr:haloacid dehalogenase-like hydrolase [Marinilabiliaceae bacterium JC017]
MKTTFFISNLLLVTFFFSCTTPEKQTTSHKALMTWNETPIKNEIISFVEKVTSPESSEFVSVTDRIAVFDNDGTLWNEKPLYIPLEYEIAYIKQAVETNPELKKNKLYKGLAEGDLEVMKEYSMFDLIQQLFAAHDNQPEKEYYNSVYSFLTEEFHPKYNRPFKEMVYQPMVELVYYLQVNEFKVFIVTGGEITFVRTVSEEIYNIPVENVVGSNIQLNYVSDSTGHYLIRTDKVISANDKQIKPANIGLHIGKKPIFAAGNSDGDYEMMEYTLSGEGPSMAILVHHDDEEREYSYMNGTEKAIEDAADKGWYVVSMKKDFKQIFPK